MVSANARRIGAEFEDMAEDRDWGGFVGFVGIAAIGGVLAEMFQDRVAPRINQPKNPGEEDTRGLAASFGVKALAALILAFLASRMDGGAKWLLGIMGVGAAVDSGVDLLEIGDQFLGNKLTGSQTVSRSNQSRDRRVRSSGGSANDRRSSGDSHNRRASSPSETQRREVSTWG